MNLRAVLYHVLLFVAVYAYAQQPLQPRASVKNNLLYDLTLTPNIGAEMLLGQQSTLQAFYGFNPWSYGHNKQFKHWSLMPEYRYWIRQPFSGHFFGIHAFGGEYSIGGVGLIKTIRDNHYEGWYAGAGLTYGHAWRLSSHWNLEAAIGVGYTHVKFDKYVNEHCGALLDNGHRNFIGPTKLAVNIAYLFGKRQPLPPTITRLSTTTPLPPPPPYEPQYQLSFVTPQAEAEKARNLSGRAYLDFVVNKTDIRPDYRRNAVELEKVRQTIDAVRQDPNTSITHISIHGYASPEGSYQNNTRLAEERAQAFKDYVQMLIQLPASIFSVQSTPEDWQGLITHLDSLSSLSHLTAIAADQTLAPDEKERRLKQQFPAEWKQLLTDVFPALRHSDYEVSYTIRPFTVEEAREIIRHKPQQLSLNEMFLVANTYEPGSQEYKEVFETAVRMYPDDETANLNAAIIALRKNNLTDAGRYLLKAGPSPQAQNARAVLAIYSGRMDEAEQLLQRTDIPEARHNLEELRKFRQAAY